MRSMFIRTLCFLFLIVHQDHYVIRASRVFRTINRSVMPSNIDESLIFNHHRVHESAPPRLTPTESGSLPLAVMAYEPRKEASGFIPLPPLLPPAFLSAKNGGPSDGRGHHNLPPPS
ncbi:hypothetical protein L1887_37353 [Cichorium endivia]|nr:hypothetical protein L1887_37353 [Cichorium endivia]